MGAGELEDWKRYYLVEPWGAWRDNLHAGIIAAMIANTAPSTRRKRARRADEFLFVDARERRSQMTQRSLHYLFAIARRKPKPPEG